MESEVNISGRVLLRDLEKFRTELASAPYSLEGYSVSVVIRPCCLDDQGNPQKALACVSIENCLPETISESAVESICKKLSEKFECLVYMVRDQEFYGVANVYNGGSDYEVVNEKCFLCAYDCGEEKIQERTTCWNEKARSMEQAFLESEISAKL